jgi:general secretion pathway protein K
MPAKDQRRERGVALILTLLILTLLVVTGLELNRAVRVEANLAGNFRDLTQASCTAQSGIEIARALLQGDDPTYDGLDEKWAQLPTLSVLSQQLFPEGYFTGQIIDENAKLNVNGLIDPLGNAVPKKKEQLERLLATLGYDPGLLDALLDWLDPDEQRRPGGAERDDYLGKGLEYTVKNGPLDTLGEMVLIRGLTPEIFYGTPEKEGLRNYLTIHSDGRVNINTAGPLVLMSLSPKIDLAMAQAVLNNRREKPFRRPEDLRSMPGWEEIFPEIVSEITVRSNYFSVEMVGHFREARAGVQAMIKREGKRTRILYWRAG